MGFTGGHSGKESTCPCRIFERCRFNPWVGLGRSHRVGNGTPLEYSCLKNSMRRGVWWAILHGATKSRMSLNTPNYNGKAVDGGRKGRKENKREGGKEKRKKRREKGTERRKEGMGGEEGESKKYRERGKKERKEGGEGVRDW